MRNILTAIFFFTLMSQAFSNPLGEFFENISKEIDKTTFLMLAAGIFATVFSGIAAWPVIQQLLSRTTQPEPLNHYDLNFQQFHVPPEVAPQPKASQSTSSSTVSQNQGLSESLKTQKQSMPEEERKKQE